MSDPVEMDRTLHDNDMPRGWHQIKCALLTEMRTAANFQHCMDVASGLFHARLIGQSVAREMLRFPDDGLQEKDKESKA